MVKLNKSLILLISISTSVYVHAADVQDDVIRQKIAENITRTSQESYPYQFLIKFEVQLGFIETGVDYLEGVKSTFEKSLHNFVEEAVTFPYSLEYSQLKLTLFEAIDKFGTSIFIFKMIRAELKSNLSASLEFYKHMKASAGIRLTPRYEKTICDNLEENKKEIVDELEKIQEIIQSIQITAEKLNLIAKEKKNEFKSEIDVATITEASDFTAEYIKLLSK